MHVSYNQATNTPLHVIRRQLEFKDIEDQFKQMKAREQNAKS